MTDSFKQGTCLDRRGSAKRRMTGILVFSGDEQGWGFTCKRSTRRQMIWIMPTTSSRRVRLLNLLLSVTCRSHAVLRSTVLAGFLLKSLLAPLSFRDVGTQRPRITSLRGDAWALALSLVRAVVICYCRCCSSCCQNRCCCFCFCCAAARC